MILCIHGELLVYSYDSPCHVLSPRGSVQYFLLFSCMACFGLLLCPKNCVYQSQSHTCSKGSLFFKKKKKDRQIALLLNMMWNIQCLSLKCQLLLVANNEDGNWKIKTFLLHRVRSSWDLWKSCGKILNLITAKKISENDCFSKMTWSIRPKQKFGIKSMHFASFYILYCFIYTSRWTSSNSELDSTVINQHSFTDNFIVFQYNKGIKEDL